MLGGRSIYLGFEGWLWTQGKTNLLKKRRRTLRKAFIFNSPDLLCNDGIDYLLWNQNFRDRINEDELDPELKSDLELEYRVRIPGKRDQSHEIYRLTCS